MSDKFSRISRVSRAYFSFMITDTYLSLPEYLQLAQDEWTTQQRPEQQHIKVVEQIARPSVPEQRYQILSTVHRDAHSQIYRVRDTLLGRVLALKHVDIHSPATATYLRQLKERTALDHPNTVRIYDIDEQQGQIVMEYVQGRNLREILTLRGTLALDVAIYIAIQLVNGLHHAHNRGVVHYALFPEHLLLTRQSDLKIIAFRTPDSAIRRHAPECDENTCYLPPEWFEGNELTPASNVYTFGIILYEMLTGTLPFSEERCPPHNQKPDAPQIDENTLPAGLAPILAQCLESLPARRETAIHPVGERLITWYRHCQPCKSAQEHLNTYKDFLLMAWADGKISVEEAAFLAHKRQELHISEDTAEQLETEVKQELKQLTKK